MKRNKMIILLYFLVLILIIYFIYYLNRNPLYIPYVTFEPTKTNISKETIKDEIEVEIPRKSNIEKNEIKIINSIKNELMQFLPKTTKVLIKKEYETKLFMDVLINIETQNKEFSSYRARIDKKTNKIMKTWDQSSSAHHHNQKAPLKISPTGHL